MKMITYFCVISWGLLHSAVLLEVSIMKICKCYIVTQDLVPLGLLVVQCMKFLYQYCPSIVYVFHKIGFIVSTHYIRPTFH